MNFIISNTLREYEILLNYKIYHIINKTILHDLRGQYVDLMHNANVPTVFISKQVGDSSTRLTNDVYSQILQDTHDYARNAIDKAMKFSEKSASKNASET